MSALDTQPRAGADDTDSGPSAGGGSLRRVLVLVNVVALAALLVAGGWLWGHHTSGPYVPNASSVDAGFARDMATHHQQAVTMASYVRDHTTDPEVGALAYDIESSQTAQMGEMVGWLDTWGVARTSGTQMNWMPADHRHVVNGLMPGMATPAQLTKLQSLTGKAMDILFLQLMIRHHQGGIPMAQYALTHAHFGYVKTMAQSILNAQGPEIVQMEQKLRQLGASPLPPPDA